MAVGSAGIAARYALKRRQFPLPGTDKKILLMDYQSHQRRLLSGIAESYALGFANNALVDPEAKAVLEKLCDLYALSNLEADRARRC